MEGVEEGGRGEEGLKGIFPYENCVECVSDGMGVFRCFYQCGTHCSNGLDPWRGSPRETLLNMTDLNQRLESSYRDRLGR